MKKFHEVESLDFEDDSMLLGVDGQKYRISLPKVSPLLAQAKESARKFFKISPAGYGIHWPAVDEDLTIDGLIGAAEKSYADQPQNSAMILNDKKTP